MADFVRDAPLGVFLVMVVLFAGMAAICVAAGITARRNAKRVAETDTAPIGATIDGYREILGRVEPIDGQLLAAPLTQTPCCWYAASVEEWRSSDRSASDWRVVRSITSSAPFFVRDASGVCTVMVEGAELTPTDRSEWYGATLEPDDRNPPRFKPAQSTHGYVQLANHASHRFRYRESRIYAGDPVLVVGALHRLSPADREEGAEKIDGDRRSRPTTGSEQAESRRSAPDDWGLTDRDAQEELSALAIKTAGAEIRRGGKGQPLIVTTTGKAEHVAMTEHGSQAAFAVALVPLGIALLIVLARFG